MFLTGYPGDIRVILTDHKFTELVFMLPRTGLLTITFVRMDFDNFTRNLSGGQQMSPDQSRSGTNGMTGTTGMPDFRGIKSSVKLISRVFWLEIKKNLR